MTPLEQFHAVLETLLRDRGLPHHASWDIIDVGGDTVQLDGFFTSQQLRVLADVLDHVSRDAGAQPRP